LATSTTRISYGVAYKTGVKNKMHKLTMDGILIPLTRAGRGKSNIGYGRLNIAAILSFYSNVENPDLKA
jgi:hypothetical protein